MSNNKPNNSGDGELVILLACGAAAAFGGYQLSAHLSPDSWFNVILGKLAHLAGQPATPKSAAIIAAGLGFALGIGTAMYCADLWHRGKKKRAALKMMRDTRELEKLEAKLAAKENRTTGGRLDRKSLEAVAENFTQPETQPGQATRGFIFACAVGFGVVFLIAAHFFL